jgi:hypothetical protein
MPELAITEVAAWALIAAGGIYYAMDRYGAPVSAGAVAAALGALAIKSVLLAD